MKHITAVILAAGKAPRFKELKGLLEFDGLPLIARTLGQLASRNIPVWIITRDVAAYTKAGLQDKIFQPAHCRWQTQTMLSSRKLWGVDQTLILNGDVYYSDRCIDLLVKGKTIFYCGEAEIWGLSIDKKQYERAEQTAKRVIAYHNKRPDVDENMWCFYRLWHGQHHFRPVRNTPGLAFQKAGTVIMVFDNTVDFDFPIEYERWQKGLRGREVKAPNRAPLCKGRTVVEFIAGTDTWHCPITKKTYRGFAHCEPKRCPHHVPQS